MLKALTITGGVLVALSGLTWAGVSIQPAPFAPVPRTAAAPDTIALPVGLPAPVERFYRTIYGEQIPVINTAIVSGRGVMQPAGPVALPMRFRFVHETGRDYRHYIEATLFGLSIMQVNEYYVGGKQRGEMPWGVTMGERYDQAANLGLWAEALWFPALWVTDPAVHWQAVDDQTALLTAPFGERQETFVMRFDPQTGLLTMAEAMRYKGDAGPKVLWIGEVKQWSRIDGMLLPAVTTITWADDGKPWVTFRVEESIYNEPVDVTFEAKGP